MANSKSPGSAI